MLFWGILGAMVMRGVFIVAGIRLIERFEWIIYIFGALLVYTAYRLVRSHGVQVDPEKNPLVRLAHRFFPVEAGYQGRRFFVRRDGRLFMTPLVIALVAIESADLVFAIDSVPGRARRLQHHLRGLHQQHRGDPRAALALLRPRRQPAAVRVPQLGARRSSSGSSASRC